MHPVEYIIAGLGLFVATHTLVSEWRHRRNRNAYRHEWFYHYGCRSDPIRAVWRARDHEHAERQRKLDASQNVLTRLV